MRHVRFLRVLSLIAVALLGAACTSAAVSTTTSSSTSTSTPSHPSPTIAVDLSATPAGWVPVAYRDAQVSVPATFTVAYPGMDPCLFVSAPGTLFVAPVPTTEFCPAALRPARSTEVVLTPIHLLTKNLSHLTHRVVHSVPVLVLPRQRVVEGQFGNGYIVPSLGVAVSGTGPLLERVLGTLSRSPRDIVLSHGPAPAVPHTWVQRSFDGVSVAVPATWPVARTRYAYYDACFGGMGVFPAPPSTVLDTDESLTIPNCPNVSAVRPAYPPTDGVRVNKALFPPQLFSLNSKSCLHAYGLTVCPDVSPLMEYSILVLKVSGPTLSNPVYVSIGLAGNGTVARTILYSLRAA
jgi:hypothetical protein